MWLSAVLLLLLTIRVAGSTPPATPHRGCRVRLCCCMYPVEVSCRRGCCLANDARRVYCKSRGGADQLVPNRRRRLPLVNAPVCACTQAAAEEARSQTLLPPFCRSLSRIALSSDSSIFLLFTVSVRPVVIRLTGQNCEFTLCQQQQHTSAYGPRLLSAYHHTTALLRLITTHPSR